MGVALVTLSVMTVILSALLLCKSAVDMLGEKEEKARVIAFGFFLFYILVTVYAIVVLVYLPLPLK